MKLFQRTLFWIALPIAMAAFALVPAFTKSAPQAPAKIAPAPAFALLNQDEQVVNKEQLKGKAWIANFIFTRCATSCPLFSQKMATIRHRAHHLGDAVHFVSFSVDPDHDTPAVLNEYAKRYKASARKWSFLTGDVNALKKAIVEGFKVAMQPSENPYTILHGEYFVLVDPQGDIRGYYHLVDEDAIPDILQDLKAVLNHRPPQSEAIALNPQE